LAKSERSLKPPQITFDPKLLIKNWATNRFKSLDSLAEYKENSKSILTSSIYFGQSTNGLLSTQQLKVDFSEFQNHTFFNSAEVNVNVAFDKVINYYPFDGTRDELVVFFEKLSGYEKYIFDDLWPKYNGYVLLNSSSKNYVKTADYAGSNYNLISKKQTGRSKVIPSGDKFSVELFAYVSGGVDHQTIFQKKNDSYNNGIVLAVSGTEATENNYSSSLYFKVASRVKNTDESYDNVTMSASCEFPTGSWHHVFAEWDRSSDEHKLRLYVDGNVKVVSDSFYISSIESSNFDMDYIYVGSGSSWVDGDDVSGYYNGALDEVRVWNRDKSISELLKYKDRNVFAQDGLLLYYKFNEPNGTAKESLVLDYSGNSLHGAITSDDGVISSYENIRLQNTASGDNTLSHMTYENDYYSPILFPSYDSLVDLNTLLLSSASVYDNVNPSLITRMVPEHYFEEASYFEFGDESTAPFGTDIYETSRFNRNSTVGSHILAGLLYTWAKHFDEIKIYIDQFVNMLYFGFDDYDQAPDIFAKEVANFYGFNLQGFFDNASFSQFFDGSGVTIDDQWVFETMTSVRDKLWERVFHLLPHIYKTKGTVDSLKSYIRAFGINPDSNFRFVEYGGTNYVVDLEDKRQDRYEIAGILDMSASNSLIYSSPLSSSFYNSENNALLTSQSFSVEQIVKFPANIEYASTQSMCRLHVTGSSAKSNSGVIFNLLALSSSYKQNISSSIALYGRPSSYNDSVISPTLELKLTGVNVFDGEKWNICWGRNKSDNHVTKSSYFLMANKNNFGSLLSSKFTSSFFKEVVGASETYNVLENIVDEYNNSGSFIVIGSQSLDAGSSSDYGFLNNTTDVPLAVSRVTEFSGQVSQIRFWSKALSQEEFSEHTKNYKSVGMQNPDKFNFSASFYKDVLSSNPYTDDWARLRLDVSCDQDVVSSSAGGIINLVDYSQDKFPVGINNEVIWTGSKSEVVWDKSYMYGQGFELATPVIKNEDYFYSSISPYWDEPANGDKVSINESSVYEVDLMSERIVDDRFSVEFSVVRALNDDIVNIFSTIKDMTNYVGSYNDMFSSTYCNLESLRMTYFNRLRGKINIKGFFDFFVWFDQNIFKFAKQLIPAKTNFLGNNFVIESHMLERNKYFYKNFYQYVGKDSLSVGEKNIIDNNIVQCNIDVDVVD
jgi:hypothetical protein